MDCVICQHQMNSAFYGVILGKYNVQYYCCSNCGFLRTEEPIWLEEAYKEPINRFDTGILARNIRFARRTATILYYLFDRSAAYLDYAGGYGIFTRLMRDIGFDFYWSDPFTINLLARGFEYRENTANIELVTSFESFEHFINPCLELEKMLEMSRNILFTTELLPESIPMPTDWWYYGLEHGQHVSFYSKKTLCFMAKKYGLNLYTDGINLHMLTGKKIKKIKFNMILKYEKYGVFRRVLRHMKSRTVDDMNYLRRHILLSRKVSIIR